MTPGLSIYLDLLRVLAALQVALYHLGWLERTGLGQHWWNTWGHEAVVIFFVLSGFVIRHAVEVKDRDLAAFVASRMSRLYSVAIPALALTLICDAIGYSLAPDLYRGAGIGGSFGLYVTKLAISLLMLNESWWSVGFFTNTPYWSICYEIWYYLLFAAYIFTAGRKRWVLLVALTLAAGPAILVMFPIWLMGVYAYTWRRGTSWPRWLVWAAFLQPVGVFTCHVVFDLPQVGLALLGPSLVSHLHWSSFVLSDTLLGLSFAVHLVAAKQLHDRLLRVLRGVAGTVRAAAARSFTLYLIHMPLMVVLTAVTAAWSPMPQPWLVALGTVAIPLLLAPLIENQRHRLRPWLARVWAQATPPPLDKVARA